MNQELNMKTLLLYILIFILCFLLIGRLFYMQVIRGDYYKTLSEYRSLRILETQPIRGRILDRNGVVLAENIPSFDLVVVMEDVKKEEEEFTQVAKITGLTKEGIKEILKKANLPAYNEVVVKRSLSDKERIQLEEISNDIPGFRINVSSKRYYPLESIGESFLGYVGAVTEEDLKEDSFYGYNDVIGKQGIELYYEKYLRGKKGEKEVLLDSLGRVQQVIYQDPAVPGADVYLTIDINVQKNIEGIVGDKTGVAIAMNSDGEIISMVSHPSFDPNLFVKGISEKEYQSLVSSNAFLNRAIQSSYPPGSTFKPVTLISALESKTITPRTVIYCGSNIVLGGRMFKDWVYPGAFGNQTPAEALANSSDVFFYQIGIKTGIETIKNYAEILHLDQETNLDLPFETTGHVPDPQWKKDLYGESWYVGDTANASIGQGFVLVTPIAMATFYQSLANEGTAYTPHFLSKIVSSNGKILVTFQKEVLFQYNVSKETIDTVKEGLRGLANKPDMKIMRVNNADVYAKTGSAEVGDGSVHHWLITFTPKGDEKIIGLLFFEHSSFPSSHSLAPLMRDLLKNFF